MRCFVCLSACNCINLWVSAFTQLGDLSKLIKEGNWFSSSPSDSESDLWHSPLTLFLSSFISLVLSLSSTTIINAISLRVTSCYTVTWINTREAGVCAFQTPIADRCTCNRTCESIISDSPLPTWANLRSFELSLSACLYHLCSLSVLPGPSVP